MLVALLVQDSDSATAIMKDAARKLEHAQSIQYVEDRFNEEFRKGVRTSYWYRSGGYFRAESPTITDISNPRQGWTFRKDKKIYQARPSVGPEFKIAARLGLEFFGPNFPVIGESQSVIWHKMTALRVELDGRKQMTKETKLFVYFDPKTHLPVGISANLGSLTQVTMFENLKLGAAIPASIFSFSPPKGWKKVTAESGGWK